jgi:hypothetical protein
MEWARWKRGFVIDIQGDQHRQGEPEIVRSNSGWFMALLKDKPKTSQYLLDAQGQTPKAQSHCPHPVVHPLQFME